MTVKQATTEDLKNVAELFAAYRVFYEQEYDFDKSFNFLKQRLKNNESVIFVVLEENEFLGFTQLYPSFTSVGVQEIWILNDLFVHEKHRQKGVAKMLIDHVLKYSKETNRRKVVLSTAHDNNKAQQLYEKMGFEKEAFYNYEKLTL